MPNPELKKWKWAGTKKAPNRKHYLFNEKGDVILSIIEGKAPNAKYAELIEEAESVRQERDELLKVLKAYGIDWAEACKVLYK